MRLRRGETPEWLAEQRERATSGEVEAMLTIARIARRTPETAGEAERWLREAAGRGSLEGMHQLGVMLVLRGEEAEGEALMRASADGGRVEAMYDLCWYYDSRGMREQAQTLWDTIPHGQ